MEKQINRQKSEIHITKEQEQLSINRDMNFMSTKEYVRRIVSAKDTASLGSTSWKENTNYKKKRNANIRNAKKLSPKATAYTLELRDHLKSDKRKNFDNTSTESLLMSLDHVRFTEEMFFADMILKNFDYYISLVDMWITLKERDDVQPDDDRMIKIEPMMELFSKRMDAFLNANRLTLLGSVLGAKQKATELTPEELVRWYNLVGNTRNKENREDDADTLKNCSLNAEEIDSVLNNEENENIQVVQEPLSMVSATERIQNIQQLKKTYEEIKKRRLEFEKEKYVKENTLKKMEPEEGFEAVDLDDLMEEPVQEQAQNGTAEEKADQKALDLEKLIQLKRNETEAKAVYLLAYKEAIYQRAKLRNDPKAAGYLKELKRVREDVRRIKDRHQKEELKWGGKVQMTRSVRKITKAEAINTYSDQRSYLSRNKLLKLNNNIMGKVDEALKRKEVNQDNSKSVRDLKKVLRKIETYASNTRYDVGYNKETDNLRSAIKALKEFRINNAHNQKMIELTDPLKQYFDNLTKGNLDTKNIPNHKLKDFTGQRPVEGGAHTAGWKRNGILTTFSHWSDKRDTPLFSHEPSVNDLKQRMVSNCYMVSSIASLVEMNPDYIKNMMKDNGDGTVTVRLYVAREKPAQNKPEEELTAEERQKKADKQKLSGISDLKNYDYKKEPENEEKRKEQLVVALMKADRQRTKGGQQIDLKGINESSEQLLEFFGSKVKTYSTAEKLVNDLTDRIPEFREYLESGKIGGKALEELQDLGQKVWEAVQKYSQEDSDGLDAFLNDHRKELELEEKDMEEVFVKVDKEVPRLFNSDLLSAGALWMQMIERAMASLGRTTLLNGKTTGYRSLWYGDGSNVIQAITGSKGKNEVIDDALFMKICRWKEDNIIYTTGSKNKSSSGVDSGHAYSILGGYVENGQRYVRLRNPYSQGSSSYDYGKGEETYKRNESLNFIGGSDESYGQFDMKWEDFIKDFGTVSSNNMNGFEAGGEQ